MATVGWLLISLALVGAVVGGFAYAAQQKSKTTTSSSQWPPVVRSNFVGACMSTGGSESQCSCYFREVQKTVTYDEYVTAEAAYMQGEPLPTSILKAGVPCMTMSVPESTMSAAQTAARRDELLHSMIAEFEYQPKTWRRFSDEVLRIDTICVTIAFTNVGSVDGAPMSNEFSLVAPSGHVALPTFALDSTSLDGQLVIPGAGGNGEVCFRGEDEHGEFTLRWLDLTFGTSQLEWKIAVD